MKDLRANRPRASFLRTFRSSPSVPGQWQAVSLPAESHTYVAWICSASPFWGTGAKLRYVSDHRRFDCLAIHQRFPKLLEGWTS